MFLYGALANGRERADVRAGGLEGLTRADALRRARCPTTGRPSRIPRRAPCWSPRGRRWSRSTSTSRRDDVELAKEIAAGLREAGGGPAGVRAIGLYLPARGRAQVSLNVHDPQAVPLAELVARVRERAPVAEAELVGLAPRAAFEGFPDDVPLRGFDPERHLIEEALGSLG